MKLDNKKALALITMMEECAELQKACSKILRFGEEGTYPNSDKTHLDALLEETGDVAGHIGLIMAHFNLDPEDMEKRSIKKIDKTIKRHPELFLEI